VTKTVNDVTKDVTRTVDTATRTVDTAARTVDTATLMPPPPSELNQWEKDVLLRWASEKPPAQ